MLTGGLRAALGVALIFALSGCATANTAQAWADLALTVRLEDRDRAAAPADAISLRLDVFNNGPADAKAVVVTALLSPGLVHQSSTGAAWICGQVTQTVTCELATLASGQVSTFVLNAGGPEEPSDVWSTAEVSSSTPDPDDRNNHAEVFSFTSLPAADLWLVKEPSTDSIQPGGLFTYTMTVGNDGPRLAEAVTLRDILPVGMEVVSASASQGTCSNTLCTIGSLASGARVTVTVTVAAPSLEGVYAHTPSTSRHK